MKRQRTDIDPQQLAAALEQRAGRQAADAALSDADDAAPSRLGAWGIRIGVVLVGLLLVAFLYLGYSRFFGGATAANDDPPAARLAEVQPPPYAEPTALAPEGGPADPWSHPRTVRREPIESQPPHNFLPQGELPPASDPGHSPPPYEAAPADQGPYSPPLPGEAAPASEPQLPFDPQQPPFEPVVPTADPNQPVEQFSPSPSEPQPGAPEAVFEPVAPPESTTASPPSRLRLASESQPPRPLAPPSAAAPQSAPQFAAQPDQHMGPVDNRYAPAPSTPVAPQSPPAYESSPSENYPPAPAYPPLPQTQQPPVGQSEAPRPTTVNRDRYSSTPVSPVATQNYPPVPKAELGGQPGEGRYRVQPGDNFYVISQRLYGSGAYFKALYELNKDAQPRPDRLKVGSTVLAPAVEDLTKRFPHLCPKLSRRDVNAHREKLVSVRPVTGRPYVVQEGDTLFEIAKHELGDASKWADIWSLNRELLGEEFDYLTPGMRIQLPSQRPAENITTRPGAAPRRE